MEYILNSLDFVSSNFLDPKKRIFIGYLFSGFCVAFIWTIFIKKLTIINSLKFIFDKRIYFAKSAITDYFLYIFNLIIIVLFSPILLTQLTIATLIFELLHSQELINPIYNSLIISSIIPVTFTFCYFVFDDFSKFLVHMLMHRVQILWSFHKVHHSAEVLTPMTVFRTHPIEGVIFILRSTFTQGLIIGFFYFVTSGNLNLVTIVGANIFSFTFHLLGSNLRHSHISISYWKWLEYILISPGQHQIHHSVKKEHHDKNFGVTFAFWDLIFKSLVFSRSDQKLVFGLRKNENSPKYNLIGIYVRPFIESYYILKSFIKLFFYKFDLYFKNNQLNLYKFKKD